MLLSIEDQVVILLASVYGGLMLGLIFGLYRFFRGAFRFGRMITFIGDMLFWAAALVVTLSIVYRSSSGLVRVYQLLGFGLGTMLYFYFLGDIVQTLLNALAYFVRGLFYVVVKLIRGPLRVLSNILWKPYKTVKTRVGRTFDRMAQDARKYLPLLKNKK
ncbi:MAG TPA: spore cortex biosynthesis protein YabQ [Bacillota bacterium]|jgi:spore cortex biosynthesis protein YabQ|nr:spore cortex biosynthesis protein YabQ [Bacillota bacterium]